MTGAAEPTVAKVITREQGRCARCGVEIHGERGMGWSIHHRMPRGSGGARHVLWINLTSNLLLVCGSGVTGCHGWIEGNRAEAADLGWLVSRNGVLLPVETPVHHAIHGLVLLGDDGEWIPLGSVA